MKNESTSSALDKAYSELVAAVVKAVPGIQDQPCTHKLMADENGCPFLDHSRPITLEDVLRWMDTLGGGGNRKWWNVCSDGMICVGFRIHAQWHLGKPLSEQSDELKLFLHSLLVP